MVAYADNVTVFIDSPSRELIESAVLTTMGTPPGSDSRSKQAILTLISTWGVCNRLEFSSGKSATMPLRWKPQRAPIIKMKGNLIRAVQSMDAPGLVIDASFSFA